MESETMIAQKRIGIETIASFFNIIGFTTSIKQTVEGRSGAKYVVDMVAKKAEAPIERFILVKCKLPEKAELLRVDEVTEFWAKTFDIGADRGIIITTSKLDENAERYARFNKIPIIQGKNADELKKEILLQWHEEY